MIKGKKIKKENIFWANFLEVIKVKLSIQIKFQNAIKLLSFMIDFTYQRYLSCY